MLPDAQSVPQAGTLLKKRKPKMRSLAGLSAPAGAPPVAPYADDGRQAQRKPGPAAMYKNLTQVRSPTQGLVCYTFLLASRSTFS